MDERAEGHAQRRALFLSYLGAGLIRLCELSLHVRVLSLEPLNLAVSLADELEVIAKVALDLSHLQRRGGQSIEDVKNGTNFLFLAILSPV